MPRRPRTFHVYILASHARRLHVGVTSGLLTRLGQHREGHFRGFTAAYGMTRLVYFEEARDALAAFTREKQLERWPRWRKERLIARQNAGWVDRSAGWFAERAGPGRPRG